MKTVVIFLLLVFTSYSQPLKYKESSSIKGYYAVFSGAEYILNDEGYTVTLNREVITGKTLSGKKLCIRSGNALYMAVVSFSFSEDKTDYPITIDVYNSNLELTTYTFTAPYDLPHPSINVTDNGDVILFDPLTYKIEFLSGEGKKEYILEKEIDFEMERAFFTAIDGDDYYLLISEPRDNPIEKSNDVFLYVTGDDFILKEKRNIGFDIPVGLFLYEGKIIVSGAEFRNSGVSFKSFIIDEEIREIPYAFERLIRRENGYAAKYGNKILLLDEELRLIDEKIFNNYITDIAETEAGLLVLIKDDTWRFYNIGENMDIKKNVLLEHTGRGKPPVIGFAEDTLLLHTDEYTYIFNEFVRRIK
jgi:hypothetical protein